MTADLYIEKLQDLEEFLKKNPNQRAIYKDIHINYFINKTLSINTEIPSEELGYNIVRIPNYNYKINKLPLPYQDKLMAKYLFD